MKQAKLNAPNKGRLAWLMRLIIDTLNAALTGLLVGFIRLYALLLSPIFPDSCRFSPSCSQYAQQAIRQWGPLRGVSMAVWRILRCNPWGSSGYDPVPKRHGTSDHADCGSGLGDGDNNDSFENGDEIKMK